jgi:hypothetical protein
MRIVVERADALQFSADVLVVRYSQALFGLGGEIVERFRSSGLDLSASLPATGDYRFVDSRGIISAASLLLLGVERPVDLDAPAVRRFGSDLLTILARVAPQARHVALTVPKFLGDSDERATLDALLAGLRAALAQNASPGLLERLSFVERNDADAEQLAAALHEFLPDGELEMSKRPGALPGELPSMLAQAIGVARQLLCEPGPDCRSPEARVLDAELLLGIIDLAGQGFARTAAGAGAGLTERQSGELAQAMEELAASTGGLRRLAALTSLDDTHQLLQLVLTCLSPFQVGFEVAVRRVRDSGFGALSHYLRVLGLATLLAAYDFLGQSALPVRDELIEEVTAVQVSLLDATALGLIPKNQFPWTRVQRFLSLDGAGDLLEVYQASL